MIILDTNVVSEPLRPSPAESVILWLDRQDPDTLFLTAISLAELRYGIAVLPKGRRQKDLREALDQTIDLLFDSRILVFDEAAAGAYADIRSKAKAEGKAMSVTDGYIAAIAAAHGFAVATRDVSPFEAAGVPIINPWSAA